MKKLKDLIQGILFGSSCLIPGFSGGTMLVILGVYERVTYHLANLFKHPLISIKNLFYFCIGTIVGIVLSVIIVSKALNNYPLITGCFFVGLIIGTIPIILKNLNIKKMNVIDILCYLIFLIIGLYLTLFANNIYNINVTNNLNLFNGGYIFITSTIASAVMIIPAASGMTILLIMGLYDDVMLIMQDIILGLYKGNLSPILNNGLFLVLFLSGIILGIVLISKLITYILKKKPSLIWSSVLGLLVVSVISIYNDVFLNRLNAIVNISVVNNIVGSVISLTIGIILMILLYKKNK